MTEQRLEPGAGNTGDEQIKKDIKQLAGERKRQLEAQQ